MFNVPYELWRRSVFVSPLLRVALQPTAVTVRTSVWARALPNPPHPRAAASWRPSAGRPPQGTSTTNTAIRSTPTAGASGASRCVSATDSPWAEMTVWCWFPLAPVPPADLEKMSSLERIAFLQEKLQDIRNHYLLLKSEVASIDRRRKRMKKKERESECLINHGQYYEVLNEVY